MLCLIVAFSAGTALVWSALGRTGQLAVMTAVTTLLLVGAATIRRLPSTAEALAAAGLAGCVVDAVAARTLHLSVVSELPLHSYVAMAAMAVAGVTVMLWAAAPRLQSPPIAWSSAALVAAVAAVDPTSLDRIALLTPIAIVLGLSMDYALRQAQASAAPARLTNAGFVTAVAVVGFGAALHAAAHRDIAGLCGAALPLALFALPALARGAAPVSNDATAWLAGAAVAALLTAAGVDTSADVRVAAAVTLLVLAAYLPLPVRTGWSRRTQIVVSTLAAPGIIAWASLVTSPHLFADVDFVLAGAAAGVALAWPRSRDGRGAVQSIAFGTTTALATIGAALTAYLHHVTTPEAYVATPAALALAWGTAALIRDRQLSSTVLAPGLLIGLFPTLVMALDGNDHERQIVLLVVAAIVTIIGAELRLGTPLAAGGALIGLLGVRLIGPELAAVPRWVMFAAVGAVLLTLGATWEARLADARRLRGILRPRLEALR